MSKVLINETTLSAIGDAIREKGGTTALLSPTSMPNAILALTTGNVDVGDIPETAFTLEGNCDYWNYAGTWDWFCELFGSQMDNGVIKSANRMFYDSNLKSIPFDIFLGGSGYNDCREMFMLMGNLSTVSLTVYRPNDLAYMFYNCGLLKTINLIIETTDYVNNTSISGDFEYMFANCKKLTSISNLSGLYCYGSGKNLLNCNAFKGCNALTAIRGIDIGYYAQGNVNYCGYQPFKDCYALEELTFTFRSSNLSNQTLDITGNVGYQYDINTSKYNRTSAVNTINSLPDLSNGSNNIIKFNGNSGLSTDGGAISTMTEEEVAVAVAKGWTVSYV